MTVWLVANWEYVLIGFMVLEKIVRLTPMKQDDVVFDMVLKPIIYGLAGKKKDDSSGKPSA